MSKYNAVKLNIVELNTVDPPTPGFMDETPRVCCSKCGSRLRLGHGMDVDPQVEEISMKHIELCEGDPAVTLLKIDQWWKAGRPDLDAKP
jgi:hypothetical protein